MAQSTISAASWQKVKQEIREILIGLAKLQKTIAYSELAAQIRSAYIHYRAPAFDHILQELCEDEVKSGHPILGVLVVNKQTKRCGAGFFKWCAHQGYDVSDPERFWNNEFDRVCDYWDLIEVR